jgi:hypothetical protein
VARDDRIVIFDFGSNVVNSIRLDGTLEWKAGGRGRGPGEYVAPTGISIDSAGRVLVLDPDTERLTVLDRNGKLVHVIRLLRRFELALAVPGSLKYLLVNSGSDTLIAMSDTSGVHRPVTLAPPELRATGSIAREMVGAIPSPSGTQIGLRWSSRMLIIDRAGKIARTCLGVDSLSIAPISQTKVRIQGAPVRFVRVDARARKAAVSMAAFDRTVGVLHSGTSPGGPSVLDIYAADCGRYLESRALPIQASSIAGTRDLLIAMLADPVPHLTVLRWVPAGK